MVLSVRPKQKKPLNPPKINSNAKKMLSKKDKYGEKWFDEEKLRPEQGSAIRQDRLLLDRGGFFVSFFFKIQMCWNISDGEMCLNIMLPQNKSEI